jgi:hypothetical protein
MLALAPAASAHGCTKTLAPPGLSAVSEYVETIPTPCGARPTSTVQPGEARARGALSPSAARALAHSGSAGTAVSALVRATGASPVARPTARRSRQSHRRDGASAPAGSGTSGTGGGGGGSPIVGVLRALTGTGSGSGGGLGPVLLAILIACGIAAAGVVAVRRRRSAS